MRGSLARSFFACVCGLAAASFAAEKPRVVVLGISGSSEKLKQIGESVAEQVLTELGKTELVEAMGTSDVQAVLGMERQKQMLGCSENSTSCLAEISAALGAPWLVSGTIGQFGKTTRLDIKLIRAKDGKAIFRDGTNFQDESELFERVTGIVAKLVARMDLKKEPHVDTPVKVEPVVVAPSVTGPVEPPLSVTAPAGPAQAAAPVGPWVMTGLSAGVVIGGAVMVGLGAAQRADTQKALASLTPPSYGTARRDLGDGDTMMLVGGIVGGVGVAALGTAIGWLIMGKTEAPKVSLGVGVGSIVVQGEFR